MRVICVKKRWDHHASGSGYDRLSEFLGARIVPREELRSAAGRLASKIWARCAKPPEYLLDYRLGDRIAEERAFWLAMTTRADIVHVLYGDEQLDVLLKRTRHLSSRLVATFHLPASRVKQRFEELQKDDLQRLAGAVVVASPEVAAFSQWLGPGKVMFIPHGIDTKAFRPAPPPCHRQPRLLLVGAHMRDFEVAHRVIDLCARDRVDIAFDLVVPAYGRDFFTGCERVTFHTQISDDALRRLYGEATALFLPLVDATANNSILEALASGLPVISTDVGGIKDYVDPSCGWLLPPGDVAEAFALVSRIATAPQLAHALRDGARRKAESLDWQRVTPPLLDGYRRLLAQQPFAVPDPVFALQDRA